MTQPTTFEVEQLKEILGPPNAASSQSYQTIYALCDAYLAQGAELEQAELGLSDYHKIMCKHLKQIATLEAELVMCQKILRGAIQCGLKLPYPMTEDEVAMVYRLTEAENAQLKAELHELTIHPKCNHIGT